MGEPIKCPRCGLKCRLYTYPGGTTLELEPYPSKEGFAVAYWALRAGVPVAAVEFSGGKPIGRRAGFETDALYEAHYRRCVDAVAATAQSQPGRTGAR